MTDNVPVLGNGLSTVGEDLPIGGIIYSSSIFKSRGQYIQYTCNEFVTAMIYRNLEVVTMPLGPPVISGGEAIYPTNVTGVGVSFSIWSFNNTATTFPDYWEGDYTVGQGLILNINPSQQVAYKLIKTGPVDKTGIQKISASSFPTFRIRLGAKTPVADEKNVLTIQFQGDITLHTKTCQISAPQIDVDLGSHEVNGFTGPGTVTPWKKFDIRLVDCPPFYGYGFYDMWMNDLHSETVPNKVALTFNSAYGTVSNNTKLAKIESGPNAASGVGIELSQADDSTSISLDGSSGFELKNLNTNDNNTYVIPMQARYVQYESEVKAGLAKGAVVFTVTYQ
ncbi:type 1 fimbrial protein (plasmid) [Klebsiella sp. BDA134-6]|uniref:fimbrial protein n=1 Tax=Klebsiella sp. BDA134-6 TaxID=2787706 RepID=UPI00189F4D7B|nr:fimbrial protein [Klebsiella sp. BDA134-6]QPF30580.1 type 1 fimbrial protein [Klebsiella sp. BDA134-6]